MKKAPKILYFIRGSVPTKEEQDEADTFGANVAYRNVEFMGDEAPEAADGVAGGTYQEMEDDKPVGEPVSLIPHKYRSYPKAADVVAAYRAGKDLPKAEKTAPAPAAAGWTAGK